MNKSLKYIIGFAGVITVFYLGKKLLVYPKKQNFNIKNSNGTTSIVKGAVQTDYKNESFGFSLVDNPNIYYAEKKENGEFRVGSKVNMQNMRINAGDRLGIIYSEEITPLGILNAYHPIVMNISGQPTLTFISKSQSRL